MILLFINVHLLEPFKIQDFQTLEKMSYENCFFYLLIMFRFFSLCHNFSNIAVKQWYWAVPDTIYIVNTYIFNLIIYLILVTNTIL